MTAQVYIFLVQENEMTQTKYYLISLIYMPMPKRNFSIMPAVMFLCPYFNATCQAPNFTIRLCAMQSQVRKQLMVMTEKNGCCFCRCTILENVTIAAMLCIGTILRCIILRPVTVLSLITRCASLLANPILWCYVLFCSYEK